MQAESGLLLNGTGESQFIYCFNHLPFFRCCPITEKIRAEGRKHTRQQNLKVCGENYANNNNEKETKKKKILEHIDLYTYSIITIDLYTYTNVQLSYKLGSELPAGNEKIETNYLP